MLDRALDALNGSDAGSLPAPVQAQVLRALGRAEARETAARARVLAAPPPAMVMRTMVRAARGCG